MYAPYECLPGFWVPAIHVEPNEWRVVNRGSRTREACQNKCDRLNANANAGLPLDKILARPAETAGTQ